MRAAQKSECPVAAGQVAEEINQSAGSLAQDGDDGKAKATLVAQFALRGHSVYELADGGFLVSRWGMTRACPDLHALKAFARQIGVRA